MQECITHNFFSCYHFDDNRGGKPAGCLLGVAGVSLDASGHIVHRAGRGLWPTMANLRKNEYVFIFARFSAFMILRAPFAPPPLKWPVAASHCSRLTATLPTPKINGPMDDEVHFFFVLRLAAGFFSGGTAGCLLPVAVKLLIFAGIFVRLHRDQVSYNCL